MKVTESGSIKRALCYRFSEYAKPDNKHPSTRLPEIRIVCFCMCVIRERKRKGGSAMGAL